MDIVLWIAAVILTKAIYFCAVKTVHKNYSKDKIIKASFFAVAVSLIADAGAFFAINYRVYLLIDISLQFVVVYIWSMIRIRVFSKVEFVLRIVAMFFPLLLTGFVEYYKDENNLILEGMFMIAGTLVSLLMYNYAFCLTSKVEQANELEAKSRQVEIIQEQKKQLSDNYREYRGFLSNYHEHLVKINNSDDKILMMNNELDEITNDFNNLKVKKYCANTIVNAILNQTARRCKEEGITYNVTADMPMNLDIDDIHLCSIFNNLMNNAVKANEYVEQDKFITVNCSLTGNYMRISVENAFNPEHRREKRKGYGMLILRELADKYDGEYSVRKKKNVFYSTFIAKFTSDFAKKEV